MPKRNSTNSAYANRRITFKRVIVDATEHSPEHVTLDIDFPLGLRVTQVPGTGRVRIVIARDGEATPDGL